MANYHPMWIACVLLTACASAPPAPAGPRCETAGVTPAPLEEGWWRAGDAACPTGGTLKVIDQKKSITRMCLLNGVQHGPFRAESGDVVLSEGWYVHGKKHGSWRRYDGIQKQFVVEKVECDHVLERVPEKPPEEEPPE